LLEIDAVTGTDSPIGFATKPRVSPRTTSVELIGSFPRGYLARGSCSLTPDRQAIICALAEENSDAWIIDDFDPDMHSEKR
jgi:hypothetical protein